MKKRLATITIIMVGALAFAEPLVALVRTITVVGEGYVSVRPDMARTQVGVMIYSEDLKSATAAADKTMQNLLQVLQESGIAQRDMQTANYSIHFERDPAAPRPVWPRASRPQGRYRVTNTLIISVRNLDAIADVLNTALEAGANEIWGIHFGVDDAESLESQARALAMANARAKAEELAELANVIVGHVVSISEVIGAESYPVVAMSMAERGRGAASAVAPGELDILVRLQVVFAIE